MRQRIAAALDRTAVRLYEAGHRVGGEWGGWLADRLSDACLGPLHDLMGVPPVCACGQPGCADPAVTA